MLVKNLINSLAHQVDLRWNFLLVWDNILVLSKSSSPRATPWQNFPSTAKPTHFPEFQLKLVSPLSPFFFTCILFKKLLMHFWLSSFPIFSLKCTFLSDIGDFLLLLLNMLDFKSERDNFLYSFFPYLSPWQMPRFAAWLPLVIL